VRAAWLLLALACASAFPAAAAPRPTAAPATPFLVALSVADLDRSMAWYGRHLGFSVLERRSFPELKLSLAFLERDGFRLELVALDGSRDRREAAPDPANEATLRGYVKLGFLQADIDPTLARLRAAGVPVVVGPFDEPERGLRSAIVTDPDGNLVQLFERLPAPRR
jgi:glyoxylase I family protein